MTIKKNLDNEMDATWRRKGGSHRCNIPIPEVCTFCGGTGRIGMSYVGEDNVCPKCEGTGEVWE